MTSEQRKALTHAFAALSGQVSNYRQKAAEYAAYGAVDASKNFEEMASESQESAEIIIDIIRGDAE